MATEPHPKPSFSPYRKWGIGLHVLFLSLIVLSVVVMVNYISRDYFLRFHASTRTRLELSPRTIGLLRSLTNQVKVTLYYDTDDSQSLYTTVADLLGEYRLVDPRITVQTVDYIREPGLAQKVKAKYKLSALTDKNLVIFDCGDKVKMVPGNGLASYVIDQVTNQAPGSTGLQFERKPAAFLGEIAFTGALVDVTSSRLLKAYFLQDNDEHQIDSGDEVMGYLKFAYLLQQNCITNEPLSLLGTNVVPSDCSLLVVAGPRDVIPDSELDKIEQYLNQGGRLLALFNFGSFSKNTGLEGILAKWGVEVGHNVVTDPDNSAGQQKTDVIVNNFGTGKHPIVNSLLQSRLHLSLPRTIGRLKMRAEAADAPHVDEIAYSGPNATIAGGLARRPPFPLMVAVEKGAIKDVITERGSTRMVVVGDSVFLGNLQIDSAGNRDFAASMVNWLLERTQLLAGVGPQRITQYKIVMTQAQMHQAQWVLLGALPGCVLVLGGLVWLRRRR
jgi:ABC-2 type transport system permease protein